MPGGGRTHAKTLTSPVRTCPEPDLGCALLVDANLAEVTLRGAHLAGSNLRGADLRDAKLGGANLGHADLRDADLCDANMRGAVLERTQLDRARLNDADLVGANLTNSSLCEIQAVGVRLWEAILRGATMTKATLSGANLGRADLAGADLTETLLSGAEMRWADLRRASLRGADLSRSHLVGTDLRAALLDDADLTNANLGDTSVAGVDLRSVEGLNTCVHHAPSSVGVDTLVRSKGEIPEAFLRGCGVPEGLIQSQRALFGGSAIDFYSCFISYSHADSSFARRLYDALQGRGIRCWLDEHQLKPGHDIYEEVDRGIKLWDKVLLCCSESSLTSWWVHNEVDTVFGKEQKLMRDRKEKVRALIPIDLDGYLFSGSWKSGKEVQVKTRLAADFKGWEMDNDKFESAFESLVKALQTDEGREKPPEPKL